jgi:magnesium transporter
MLLDLKFSILTLAITAGTFVAALYGMNLKNFIEESDLGFYGISGWCTLFGVIVAAYGLQKLRKVQRVSMYGHGPGSIVSKGLDTRAGSTWGLGAWGGGGARVSRPEVSDVNGYSKKGDNLTEAVIRERALARRLAKAELRADEVPSRP